MILLPPHLAYDKAPVSGRAAGILLVNYDNEALFTRRTDTGEWSIPFGGAEGDETPAQTAQREFGEETGFGPKGGDWEGMGRWEQIDEHNGATTFMASGTTTRFEPKLNDEHTEARWANIHEPPDPLHPSLKRVLAHLTAARRANDASFRGNLMHLAFDRSVQRMDPDGRLHIEIANISKANVCPYLGSEIPGHEELGLDPNKIYYLLRDPEELEKAAPTFNNIPILDEHIPHSAEDPQEDKVIGTTGSEASFEAPYLRNSLAFWKEGQIEEIRSKERRELSASYRYRPDMTPGVYKGVRHDGVMRDIIGNHVALVKDGRAGDDVFVGDSMKEILLMAKKAKKTPLSGIAAFALGSLAVHLKPKLAADAKLDLSTHLVGVTRKNFAEKKKSIFEGVKKAATPLLAADAQLDDVLQLLDAVEKVGMDDETMAAPVDGTMDEFPKKDDDKDKAKDEPPPFKGKPEAKDEDKDDDADDEDVDEKDKKKGDDEFPDKDKDKAKDKVMGKDAVNKVVAKAVEAANANNAAVRMAEREVHPWVGDLAIAYDSPDKVYGAALDLLGIETKGVHASAFPAMLKMVAKPGEGPAPSASEQFAHDSANAASFTERFPEAARIRAIG